MFNSSATQENSLPVIPALPVLGENISFFKPDNSSSILDYPYVSFVTSGESAIYHALKTHGVKKNDQVLIPSYHCPSMVEPVINLGAKPVFYAITPSIDIDIDSIKNNINQSTVAIIVPHFFGVRSDIRGLKEACLLPKSICIIEDCAHAFFSYSKDAIDHGNYIVGSLTKFFPTHDGGVLATTVDQFVQSESLSFKQELKAAYNAIHDAVRFGRFKSIAWVFSLVGYLRGNENQDSDDEYKHSNLNSVKYDENYHKQMDLSASKACKYIVAHVDYSVVANKRRENYQYILKELASQQNIDLSLNNLDRDFIPYMVIVRLLDPENQHAKLISNRLPIWRWEHIYRSSCEISKEYSKSIIQIPCHQQLTKAELVSMVRSIKQCLREE